MVKPPLRTKSIGFKVSEEEYAPGATSPFTYDQYDNLTKAGSMAWSPGYDPNTNHYQLAGTSYDLSGNVMNGGSNSYTWDPFNKMSSVSSTACGSSGCTATYDAFGRMVEFSKNSTYKVNWYTQAGVAVMSGTTLTESYLGAPGGGTFMEVGTGGQNDYLHKDWLGNVRIASLIGNQTVGGDMAYAPYGEVYNQISGSNIDVMFTGDLTQLDAGVLFDTPNRELAASNQGRWLSPDPAGAGWNQYAYATNPNSQVDPTGLSANGGQNDTTYLYALGDSPYGDYGYGYSGTVAADTSTTYTSITDDNQLYTMIVNAAWIDTGNGMVDVGSSTLGGSSYDVALAPYAQQVGSMVGQEVSGTIPWLEAGFTAETMLAGA